MSKIIGIALCSFKLKDGSTMEGKTIYTSTPIDPKRGQGVATEHFFLSAAKLAALDFVPALDQEIEALYNKYGRISQLRLLSDDGMIDFGGD